MKKKLSLATLLCLLLVLSLATGLAAAEGPGDDARYIVVNIPYDVFYRQVAGVENPAAIDAVTSATTKQGEDGAFSGKSANFWSNPYEKKGKYYAPVAYGDYSGGLQGVMFPVKLSAEEYAKLPAGEEYSPSAAYAWADYADWTAWAVGGTDADFGFAAVPAVYCSATVGEGGAFLFSPATAEPVALTAAATVSTRSNHGQYYITLDGEAAAVVAESAQIFGAVLRTAEGDYALRHLKNLYYKDFNEFTVNTTAASSGKGQTFSPEELAYFADLEGKTVTEVDYYTNTGVYRISTEARLEDNSAFVLMNIPYHDFYAAELGREDDVDAVTSATVGKARNTNVALGSYHPDASSAIAGVTYPVLVEDVGQLAQLGGRELKEDDLLSYSFSARGAEVAVERRGADALFEAPDYSWYALAEAPAYYKVLSVKDGEASFSALQGKPASVEGVTAEIKAPEGHTDIGLSLEGIGALPESGVSAVVLTDSEGAKYALHHVVNIWRGTELGWNLDQLGGLAGRKLQNIRYYTQESVTDYPVDIQLPAAGYVLMNIPYAEFYAAELGEEGGLDAITTATLKFENPSVAAGSYHEKDAETDEESVAAGVTYPVFVADLGKLDAALRVTDGDTKTIHVVSGREKTVAEQSVSGADILFCAPSHSWYVLAERPARYKVLSPNDGGYSFSAVSGRAATAEGVTGTTSYNTHHGCYVEIRLAGKPGEDGKPEALVAEDAIVGGIIVTLKDKEGKEATLALPHVQGIWSRTQIGWPSSAAVAGKTVTSVRIITRDAVVNCKTEIPILSPAPAGTQVTAVFSEDNRTVTVTGLPEGIEEPRVTVGRTVNRQASYLNAGGAAGDVPNAAGAVAVSGVMDGTAYTVTVLSGNYAPIQTEATAAGVLKYPVTVGNAPEGLKVEGLREEGYAPGDPVTLKVPEKLGDDSFTSWAVLTPESLTVADLTNPSITFQMPNGPVELEVSYGGCYVATAVYGSYDCPEVWTLRRYRDKVLGKTWYGRLFIRFYYAVSPTVVRLFGDSALFRSFFRGRLDRMVAQLQAQGFDATPYADQRW